MNWPIKFVLESDQQFVCKCTQTTQPIRGHEMAKIHWTMTKLIRPGEAHNESNPNSEWSENVQKLLNESEAMKWQEFTEALPKINHVGPEKAPNEFAHQIRAQSDQQFVWKCVETAWPIRDQGTAGIQ